MWPSNSWEMPSQWYNWYSHGSRHYQQKCLTFMLDGRSLVFIAGAAIVCILFVFITGICLGGLLFANQEVFLGVVASSDGVLVLLAFHELTANATAVLVADFVHLDSLSCCKVLSYIMKDITTGVAVSQAALQPDRRGEAIRDYITTMVNIISELRELFVEDHKYNEFKREHFN